MILSVEGSCYFYVIFWSLTVKRCNCYPRVLLYFIAEYIAAARSSHLQRDTKHYLIFVPCAPVISPLPNSLKCAIGIMCTVDSFDSVCTTSSFLPSCHSVVCLSQSVCLSVSVCRLTVCPLIQALIHPSNHPSIHPSIKLVLWEKLTQPTKYWVICSEHWPNIPAALFNRLVCICLWYKKSMCF